MPTTSIIEKEDNKAVRKNKTLVAPGRFLEILKEGMPYLEVNPMNTSRTCIECDFVNSWEGHQQECICSNCGFSCNRHVIGRINIGRRGLVKEGYTAIAAK